MASTDKNAQQISETAESSPGTPQHPQQKKLGGNKTNMKRRFLTLEDKYKLISAITNGAKCVEAAKLFDPPLSKSTVSTILKEKEKIISAHEDGRYNKKHKKMRPSDYPDVNKALSEWFRTVQSSNIAISGPFLQEKALYFAQQLGYEQFKASNGFIKRFKERESITGQIVCGEEKSVDQKVMDCRAERLSDICRNYSTRDRYNADETGVFWRATPTQTLNYKTEKCTGGEKSKERITVMVACNQDGSDKLPLLVIGKYAKPRCFQNTNMGLLPVIYKSQKNACIDKTIYETWVKQINRQMKAQGRHILLFVDNCSCHITVSGLTNVKVIFFSPNCTSKLQPADHGIIQNLKVFYRKTMIRRMLQCLDAGKSMEVITLKDAVFMMATAWDCVTAHTIKNCWKKAEFPGEVVMPSDDPFQSDEEDDDSAAPTLWERVGDHCHSLKDVTFREFASLDENIVTCCQLTDADATRDALEAVRPRKEASDQEHYDESDVEVIDSVEPEPISALEANASVRVLRDFIISFDKSGDRERQLVRYLSEMEDAFLRSSTTGPKLDNFLSNLKDEIRT